MEKRKLSDTAVKHIKAVLESETGIHPEAFVLAFADKDGHCNVKLLGPTRLVAETVNETMGQAVAKMPHAMQEIVMREILSHAEATEIN